MIENPTRETATMQPSEATPANIDRRAQPAGRSDVRLPRLPRLKPTIDVIRAQDGGLCLYRGIGEDFTIREGPAWTARLLELMDGSRDRTALTRALKRGRADHPSDRELDMALAQLVAVGVVEDADDDAVLAAEERERYDRQLRYFGDLAPAGQSRSEYQVRLGDACVALLGLGGLGGSAAMTLAAAGVGAIRACDGDAVELSNLHRQLLYETEDIGTPKAVAAVRRIGARNPCVDFKASPRWLDGPADVERAIAGADFVIDAVDRPAHKIERWVDAACFRARVPYIAMSQSPPFVRVGPTFVPGRTGCYACQEVAWQQRYELYDVIAQRRQPSSPAAATGPAAGVVGAIVAMEVMHYLSGLVTPATLGAAIVLDLRDLTIRRQPVEQVGGCGRCGVGRPANTQ